MNKISLDFKKLMAARFFFTFAVQMQAVVLGWSMYNLTHDPFSLGMIGLAEAIPALGLALFAGHIVDHGRPLIIYQKTIMLSLFSALILFFSQIPTVSASLSLSMQITALYLSSFLTGTARSFSGPVIFTSVPKLVPREELPTASAWMSTAMQVARIAGPALGGIIFGWLGLGVSGGFVCFTLFLALICLLLIQQKLHAPPPTPKSPSYSYKKELLKGSTYVFNHPILFPAMTLDMISVLFGGVTALLPIFASDILMVGAKGLGVLRAAPAIGATLIGLWLTRFHIRKHAGGWLFMAISGFGVCILIFGFSKNFFLSFTALLFSGGFDSISMVIRSTAVQLASPDSMRGRISAVNSIFIGSSNEIGEFESGVAAKILGTVNAVLFGGVMCLLTTLVMAVKYPALRKLNLDELQALEKN